MYERLKSKSSYPDNLVEAIDMEGVTISDIENAMKSEYLDNKDNRYRKFIRLYFKDGLTYEQIGKSVPYSHPCSCKPARSLRIKSYQDCTQSQKN